jgi:hypothetical protein
VNVAEQERRFSNPLFESIFGFTSTGRDLLLNRRDVREVVNTRMVSLEVTEALAAAENTPAEAVLREIVAHRTAILQGNDPLGKRFCIREGRPSAIFRESTGPVGEEKWVARLNIPLEGEITGGSEIFVCLADWWTVLLQLELMEDTP